ncbi:hypothetical protein JA1_003605 [Spathaspora sp. JA1]|nr:hypothetical protein JA1_003605 [Spathaspora sp. JA1]
MFDEVVTVFPFNSNYDRNELLKQDSKRKRKTDDGLWNTPFSVKLGGIVVQSIIPLTKPDNSIAVLYRDINSAYSMRYIELKDRTGRITTQLSEFEQIPTLIIPMELGGHLALDSNVYYFPPPELKIAISATLSNSDILIRERMNYLMKPTGVDGESFVSFIVLDSRRTLLATTSGNLYMLFLEIEVSGLLLVVTSLKLIKLGRITNGPPNGLHYISGNKFFASCQTCNSVVFSISSDRDPYVYIESTIEGTGSPIIDMFADHAEWTDGDGVIYTCQGGVHGSEIRKYAGFSDTFEPLEERHLGIEVLSSRVIGQHIVIKGRQEEQIVLDCESLTESSIGIPSEFIDYYQDENKRNWCITKDTITMNESSIQYGPYKFGKIFPNSVIVAITEGNRLLILGEGYRLINLPIGIDAVSSVDSSMISPTDFIVLLSGSKSIELWRISDNVKEDSIFENTFVKTNLRVELIFEDKFTETVFSSAVVAHEDGTISIILSEYRKVNHIHLTMKRSKPDVARHLITESSNNPYTIVKHGDEVIMFNLDDIVALKRNIISKQYYVVYRKMEGIVDAKFVRKDIILVCSSNAIQLFKYNNQPSLGSLAYKSIEFKEMCFKCIQAPEAGYFIVLARDLNGSNSIVVVDCLKMEILSKYETELPIKDICWMTSHDSIGRSTPYWFTVLFNSSKPLGIFKIEGNTIELVQEVSITGYNSDELYFDSINLVEYTSSVPWELKFVLYGQICMVIQLNEMNPQHMTWQARCQSVYRTSTTYAVSTVLYEPGWLNREERDMYVGDLVNGVDKCNVADTTISPIVFEPKHQYLSSMAFNSLSRRKYLISGDSLGNIAVTATLNEEVPVCKFNLGDQINAIRVIYDEFDKEFSRVVVIGTVSGALYLLSEIVLDDHEHLRINIKDIKKELIESGSYINQWKVLGKDPEELDEQLVPFDVRLVNKFLGKLTCLENNPHEEQSLDEFDSKHRMSCINKDVLQRINHLYNLYPDS